MKVPDLPVSEFKRMTKTQVRSNIRRAWMKWDIKFAVVKKQAERVSLPTGRLKTMIRCAHCSELFSRDDVEVNHKVPVGPLVSTEPVDIADYIQRMFRPVAELEALCIDCHHQHTQQHLRKQH